MPVTPQEASRRFMDSQQEMIDNLYHTIDITLVNEAPNYAGERIIGIGALPTKDRYLIGIVMSGYTNAGWVVTFEDDRDGAFLRFVERRDQLQR